METKDIAARLRETATRLNEHGATHVNGNVRNDLVAFLDGANATMDMMDKYGIKFKKKTSSIKETGE
jgi:hypothetical protein